MPQLLTGTQLAQNIKLLLSQKRKEIFKDKKVYLAIIFVGENNPSQVYVKNKQQYARDIWLEAIVFWQGGQEIKADFLYLSPLLETKYSTKEEILSLIKTLNADKNCMGIICQLPLTEALQDAKDVLCTAISPLKDVDGLWGILNGWNLQDIITFQPATAKAILDLRDYHQLGSRKGRKIAIIGMGNLIGKPLAIEAVKRGAIVQTFTVEDKKALIAEKCRECEIIISCTGAIHLVDASFINKQKDQIIIDAGYGFLNGKATGDVNFEEVAPLVKAITPVPGGIGPLTVASLFGNIFILQEQKDLIQTLWNTLL